MQLHIDSSVVVPRQVLEDLVVQGFTGIVADDVEVRIAAAPETLYRWVRECRDPTSCPRSVDLHTDGSAAHAASTPRQLAALPPDVHGPTRELPVRPRYAYTGRVRDRQRQRTVADPRFLVSLRIPGAPDTAGDRYPRVSRDPRRRSTPFVRIENWKEEVIRLVAHEARHVQQHRQGLPRSEADAERWAAARVHDYSDAATCVVVDGHAH